MWVALGIFILLLALVIWGFVWIIKNMQFSKWKIIVLGCLGFFGLILGFLTILTTLMILTSETGHYKPMQPSRNPYYDVVGKVYTWADNSPNVYSGVFADTPDVTKDKTLVPLAEVKIDIWEDSPNNVPCLIFNLISASDGTFDSGYMSVHYINLEGSNTFIVSKEGYQSLKVDLPTNVQHIIIIMVK